MPASREDRKGHDTLQRQALVTYFLQLGPTTSIFHHFPKDGHQLGPSIQHMILWGTFHIQTIT
jgi:hypothetical protein